VDASIVAKWYISEEDSEKAVQIRDLYAAGRLSLAAPLLVIYELGNALGKHPAYTEAESERAFQSFLDLSLKLRSPTEPKLLKTCFEVSRELRITFYDAAYVALTKEYDATLITADRELHDKIKEHCNAQLLRSTSLAKLTAQTSMRGKQHLPDQPGFPDA
jgi:predicted nucleic acid-binding protein